MIPVHIIAGTIDTQRGNLVFNWLLPVGLIVWAAKRTSEAEGDGPAVVAA